MSKNRRKKTNYDISGTIEVVNITKGKRKATLLNLDERPIAQKIEISGSIVQKSPIYKQDETPQPQNESISANGSGDEG